MLSIVYKSFQIVVTEVKVTSSKLHDIMEYEYEKIKEHLKNARVKSELKSKMKHSNTYSEWQENALKYDDMKGAESSVYKLIYPQFQR